MSDFYDRRINRLVYKLYGFSGEEIKIVEQFGIEYKIFQELTAELT